MIETLASQTLHLRLKLARPHTLRLFANDHKASERTVLADLREVMGGGYKPIKLPLDSWVITGNKATYPATLFSFTARIGDVHGVYILDDTSKTVVFVESFSEPFFVRQDGDELSIESISIEYKCN